MRIKEKQIPVGRQMTHEDLDAVMAIQAEVHLAIHQEQRSVFADKLARFPEGCRIAERDGRIAGYLFSHPWRLEIPPALDMPLDRDTAGFDCWYVHDLAVSRANQGAGVGRELMRAAATLARRCGYSKMALVAVNRSRPFWEKLGFSAPDTLPQKVEKSLDTYGNDAAYLTAEEPFDPVSEEIQVL